MAQKVALITGVCGQDGSYLAELLLEKGYIVHGKCGLCPLMMPLFSSCLAWPAPADSQSRLGICAGLKRRSSSFNHPRLEHIMEKGKLGGQAVGPLAFPLRGSQGLPPAAALYLVGFFRCCL